MGQNPLIAVVAWLGAAVIATADSGAQPVAGSPDGADHHGHRRGERYEFYLQRLDANHNGFLEQHEVEGQGAYLAARLSERAGVQFTYPMPIQAIREGLVRRMGQPAGFPQGPPGSFPPGAYTPGAYMPGPYMPGPYMPGPYTPGSPAPMPAMVPGAPGGPAAAPSTTPAPTPQTPKVPGFGVKGDSPAVSGFGATAGKSGGSPSVSGQSSGGAPSSSSSSSSGERIDYRIRRYAESLLRQYDKNKNGQLEKEEWSGMRGDPKAADANNDNVVTLDELSRRLSNYSQHRDSSSGPGSHGSGGSSSDSGGDAPKSYRFRTATERLPKGLPTWFAQRDADADGQVTMSEYSSTWNEGKADEFTKLDLNGDGIVTPAECLQSAEKK